LGVVYTEKKLLNEALTAFNKAVDLSPKQLFTTVDNADKSAFVLRGLTLPLPKGEKHVFTDEEIMRTSYTMDSIYLIWRCINYKRISEHIVEGLTTAEAKVSALLDWTHRNISLGAGEDFVAFPMDIMLRGYGLCDKSAYVMATLADQLGYPSAVVDLRRQSGSHAVALIFMPACRPARPDGHRDAGGSTDAGREGFTPACGVLPEGKWVVVDPCIGIVFRNHDQSIATLDDILHHPELAQITNFYRKMGSQCFANYLVCGPVASAWVGLPRMKIIQEVFNEFSPKPPKIYHNLDEDIRFALQSLFNCHDFSFPFKDKDGIFRLSLYGFPFGLRLNDKEGIVNKMQREEMSFPDFIPHYRDARLSYLIGNYKEALTQYDALLKTSPNKDYSNEIEYFKCLCWFDGKGYANAIQSLEKYLKDYPESKWKTGARYHLARSYEATPLHFISGTPDNRESQNGAAESPDVTSGGEAAGLYQKALEEYAKIEITDTTDAVVLPRMKKIEEILGE
jgi:tetratricopeptide (TPR) repeat protein